MLTRKALDRLPSAFREQAPSLARVGTHCRAVLNAAWYPSFDSRYPPARYDMRRAIPLEELGICDPMSEANFSDVSHWAMEAYGLDSPPPLERERAPTPVEEIDEEEWEERLAELKEAGLLRD